MNYESPVAEFISPFPQLQIQKERELLSTMSII